MRKRFRFVLPVVGLLLFGFESYHSVMMNHAAHTTRYKYWSAIKLDTDPLGRHQPTFIPCKDDPKANCVGWDPQYIWVHPGWITKTLLLGALPAFLVGALFVRGLGHLGVNQLLTFVISMPILITGWFYWVGRLVDRMSWQR